MRELSVNETKIISGGSNVEGGGYNYPGPIYYTTGSGGTFAANSPSAEGYFYNVLTGRVPGYKAVLTNTVNGTEFYDIVKT